MKKMALEHTETKMEAKSYKLKLLSILAIIIAVSLGFYLGLSGDRTFSVNPNFGTVTSTVYEGDPVSSTGQDMIGAWSYGANVLLPSRYGGIGISYSRNDTGWLYVMGGDVDGYANLTPRNERYCIVNNTWQVMAPMIEGLYYMGGARLKDSLYTVGGMVSSGFNTQRNYLRRYNLNSNTWTERSPLPQALGWPEAVEYQDSLIYCIGGMVNGTSAAGAQVYLYNARNNAWRTATPLPAARTGGAVAIKGDTIVYIGGSTDFFVTPVPTVYKGLISQSNRSVITWSTGLNKPGATKWRFDAHDWGCRGIIVDMGASTGFGQSSEVYVYSPGANTWMLMPNAPIVTSTSQSGSFAFWDDVHRLVCASGLVLIAPYSIPQTQIFTDTLPCRIFPTVTFCRNGLNKIIPDGGSVYDTIHVSLYPTFVVKDVDVRIDTALHTFDSDLRFYLKKGSIGQRIINRVGGSGDNFIRTRLDDSSSLAIEQGSPPFSWRFKPSPPALLSSFYDQPTDGDWILTITDTAGGDTGVLRAWCLLITYWGYIGGIPAVTVPKYYALNQNYPNPFNPVTTISYAIPKANNVKLVVYDILGREVVTLVDEFKQAAIYDVQFDASNISSGIYFYRLVTEDPSASSGQVFVQTKKMVVVK